MRYAKPKRAEHWNIYNNNPMPGVYEVQRDNNSNQYASDLEVAAQHFNHFVYWPGIHGPCAWGPKTQEALSEIAAHEMRGKRSKVAIPNTPKTEAVLLVFARDHIRYVSEKLEYEIDEEETRSIQEDCRYAADKIEAWLEKK